MTNYSYNVIYLGNNDPRVFKRGVENVIYSQSQCDTNALNYYIFFGQEDSVFRWDHIICISIKNNWQKMIKYNCILSKIRKNRRSIIHSHGPVRTLLSFFKTDILTVHDAIYYQRKGLGQKFYIIFYIIEKFAYLRSKKIHFISKYTKAQALLNSSSKKKSIIIYNTTPLEQIINSVNFNLRPKEFESSDAYTLLAVRGIQERTRIDLLIDFAEYCQNVSINDKKIKIIVAGKGPLLEFYRKDIERRNLDNIKLIGFVDDLKLTTLYNNADCVIITCDHAEGFGLPIIEGYCNNKPVIGSNKCAVPEIIIDKSFLFDNNVVSILETLLRNQKHTHNYRDYYYENFSSAVYHKKFKSVYQDLINLQKNRTNSSDSSDKTIYYI